MPSCPFCELAAGTDADLVAARTPSAIVVPPPRQRPANEGHMLVLPRAHVTRLIDAEPALLAELYGIAARVGVAARRAFGATGVTIFQNDEAPDQVLFHLHIHVVPRRAGDQFQMPDPTKIELSREERVAQALALSRALSL